MFKIQNEEQRQKTQKHIEGLKAQIERIRQKHGPERSRNFKIVAVDSGDTNQFPQG